jgi:hypothetical protein
MVWLYSRTGDGMSISRKLMTVGGGGGSKYVDDVFSTFLFTGENNNLDRVNGIDLEDKGGLVWSKCRSLTFDHSLSDTERGVNKSLATNKSDGESSALSITSFNSDGYSVGANANNVNDAGSDFVSWTFAKQKGFFDIVTYSGDGAQGREIPHKLGSEPGMIIIKSIQSENWIVYHRGVSDPTGEYLALNTTGSVIDHTTIWDATAPSESVFTLGSTSFVNGPAQTYVAYLFAHDAPLFGPNGDESIIKCGSYIGNGSTDGPEIDLGWEPQYVLLKNAGSGTQWYSFDTMRGISSSGLPDAVLSPNAPFSETVTEVVLELTPTGFKLTSSDLAHNQGTERFIYMAIRRPHKPAEEFEPEELFAMEVADSSGGTTTPEYIAGFPVDYAWKRHPTLTDNTMSTSRLTGDKYMYLNQSVLGTSNASVKFTSNTGWLYDSEPSPRQSWMFRRAPGFFDMATYAGDYVYGRDIPHNLGAVPEMMWVKSLDIAYSWNAYTAARGGTEFMSVNESSESQVNSNFWQDTDPTDQHFTVSGHDVVNGLGKNYIAMLWASVPGICDIGNYTGIAAGNSGQNMQDIDCGFTNGSRFVLVKRTNGSGNWYFVDSLRGIVVNSPTLMLNSTQTQQNTGYIQPFAGGFRVDRDLNLAGYEYIYMAIA